MLSKRQEDFYLQKAAAVDFLGRFREVISDPLNLLISRVPHAGGARNGLVHLHNGLLVPYEGDQAYYGRFSELLIVNRGVHEPLEEFIFQTVLSALPTAPRMLELGAYWGHYSMWLKHRFDLAQVHLVEPDAKNLDVGKANFARNGLEGFFEQAFVGHGQFEVDSYFNRTGLERLDILHADIQGYELEMLKGAHHALSFGLIDRLFISTHSQELHGHVVEILRGYGYRVEVSADFEHDTTSFDGFVYASHQSIAPLFSSWKPLNRCEILRSQPTTLAAYVTSTSLLSIAEVGS